jgi:hypothetical protein
MIMANSIEIRDGIEVVKPAKEFKYKYTGSREPEIKSPDLYPIKAKISLYPFRLEQVEFQEEELNQINELGVYALSQLLREFKSDNPKKEIKARMYLVINELKLFIPKKGIDFSIESSIEDNDKCLLDELIDRIGQDKFTFKKRSRIAKILANRFKFAILRRKTKVVNLPTLKQFLEEKFGLKTGVTQNGFLYVDEHRIDLIEVYNDSIESNELTLKSLINKFIELGLTEKSIFMGRAGIEASNELDEFIESL